MDRTARKTREIETKNMYIAAMMGSRIDLNLQVELIQNGVLDLLKNKKGDYPDPHYYFLKCVLLTSDLFGYKFEKKSKELSFQELLKLNIEAYMNKNENVQ